MALPDALLAVLLLMPRAAYDESEAPTLRRARLAAVAAAIADASERACGRDAPRVLWRGDPPHLAARLAVLGQRESQYARYVGEGRCAVGPAGARCDPHPLTGVPRARTYWQLWQVAAPRVWRLPQGAPLELREAAWRAAQLLAGARTRCRGRGVSELAGAYSGYRALSCRWPPAVERARHAEAIEAQLRLRLDAPGEMGETS